MSRDGICANCFERAGEGWLYPELYGQTNLRFCDEGCARMWIAAHYLDELAPEGKQ